MAQVDAMDREYKAIVAERVTLRRRLKEIAPDGKSVRAENVSEYKKLKSRDDALAAREKALHQRQLAALREKMAPAKAKEISK